MSDARTAWALIGQGRWAEAEAAARKSSPDPDVMRALAQALQIQNRHAEAEAVLRQAVGGARPPFLAMLLRDLAQLVWMQTADLTATLQPIDDAIAASPHDPQLRQVRALAQQYAGDLDGAAATLEQALSEAPYDLLVLLGASHVAAERGESAKALEYATRAARIDPTLRPVQERYAVACLAAGEADQAVAMGERLLRTKPFDQLALAVLATAWRMLGDPRARSLYDYERFVRPYTIDTPEGWPELPAFLRDLGRALEPLHTASAHPLQQSLRHGSQVQGLQTSADPVIQAFFREAAKIVGRYQADIGRGDDPLRVRNTGKARVSGAWSVRLRPTGFHVSHIHPEGWLSSAFYVETPTQALETPSREGWIKFGEPGIPTKPPIGPEHFVRPEPGRLVLFPSYMWHGTVPFTSDERRLTVAFDAVPA